MGKAYNEAYIPAMQTTSCIVPAPEDANAVFLDLAMAPSDHLKLGLCAVPFCLLVTVPLASDSMTSPEGMRGIGFNCLRRAI
jgi:hypothetical protein